MFEATLMFAYLAHDGQLRRHGPAYITHPIGVANHLLRCGVICEEVIKVALLHDVVEDTGWGFKECNHFLRGKKAKQALELLTKRDGESSRDALVRVLESGNKIALLVKAADAYDNSLMDEEGERFTREIMKKDPKAEQLRYQKKMVACLDVLGLPHNLFDSKIV